MTGNPANVGLNSHPLLLEAMCHAPWGMMSESPSAQAESLKSPSLTI